jgi:hypothetical protein
MNAYSPISSTNYGITMWGWDSKYRISVRRSIARRKLSPVTKLDDPNSTEIGSVELLEIARAEICFNKAANIDPIFAVR